MIRGRFVLAQTALARAKYSLSCLSASLSSPNGRTSATATAAAPDLSSPKIATKELGDNSIIVIEEIEIFSPSALCKPIADHCGKTAGWLGIFPIAYALIVKRPDQRLSGSLWGIITDQHFPLDAADFFHAGNSFR